MGDFFSDLVSKAQGRAPVVEPIVPALFAAEPSRLQPDAPSWNEEPATMPAVNSAFAETSSAEAPAHPQDPADSTFSAAQDASLEQVAGLRLESRPLVATNDESFERLAAADSDAQLVPLPPAARSRSEPAEEGEDGLPLMPDALPDPPIGPTAEPAEHSAATSPDSLSPSASGTAQRPIGVDRTSGAHLAFSSDAHDSQTQPAPDRVDSHVEQPVPETRNVPQSNPPAESSGLTRDSAAIASEGGLLAASQRQDVPQSARGSHDRANPSSPSNQDELEATRLPVTQPMAEHSVDPTDSDRNAGQPLLPRRVEAPPPAASLTSEPSPKPVAPSGPTVEVTIQRLEIRTESPRVPTTAQPPAQVEPRMSLEDYRRKRGGSDS